MQPSTHRRWLAAAAALALAASGCSYHRAHLDYARYDSPLPVASDRWPGERLGTVRGWEGGAIWDDCTEVSEGALWVLVQEARKLGANAIGDVRWFAEDPEGPQADPACERRWGWFVLWPGLLTPAFMGAEVEAVAYRTGPHRSEHPDGLWPLPRTRREAAALQARIALPERGEVAR